MITFCEYTACDTSLTLRIMHILVVKSVISKLIYHFNGSLRVNYDYVQQAIVLNALSRRNGVYHTAMQMTVSE